VSLILVEVYDALRAVNVPEEAARKAAEALAGYEQPLAEIRSDLRLLKWMVATTFAGVLSLVLKAFL
jgi:hypothetical protein